MITKLLVLAMFATPAYAKKKKKNQPPPEPERPVVTQTIQQAPTSAGSLWSEVPARQLMGLDANARQVGDLITIVMVERMNTALDAATATRRESSSSASIGSMLGAEQTLLNAHPNMGGKISIEAGSQGQFTGTGATSRGTAIDAVLTCEVIEVLGGGNLRVWGYKRVRVNREIQYLVVEGIVRPRDIQMNNTVTSDMLAQATVEITGSGVLADRQGPGAFARLLDKIWPF